MASIKFWTKIKRSISNRGGISYTELKTLDIKEFYVLLVNFEKEIDDEKAAYNKSINKRK